MVDWVEIPTHVARPLCRYASVHVEDGKDCRHLQIHDATADQAYHEKDRAGDFKHFNLAMVKHVGGQGDREENAEYRYGEDGDSVEKRKWIQIEK